MGRLLADGIVDNVQRMARDVVGDLRGGRLCGDSWRRQCLLRDTCICLSDTGLPVAMDDGQMVAIAIADPHCIVAATDVVACYRRHYLLRHHQHQLLFAVWIFFAPVRVGVCNQRVALLALLFTAHCCLRGRRVDHSLLRVSFAAARNRARKESGPIASP